MAVKDFMTQKVVYVSPETTIAQAAEWMRSQSVHRLPVIEQDRLVGLITERSLAEATPSKATSLSIYEMNYLLNKTTVRDVMVKDVVTISRFASLEDAVYLMYQHKIGILPVVDNDQLSGVITDRDVFAAFLHVSGFGKAGVRVRCLVEDRAGALAQIVQLIASKGYNISSSVQAATRTGKVVIEVQIEGNVTEQEIAQLFDGHPIEVEHILQTEEKSM